MAVIGITIMCKLTVTQVLQFFSLVSGVNLLYDLASWRNDHVCTYDHVYGDDDDGGCNCDCNDVYARHQTGPTVLSTYW